MSDIDPSVIQDSGKRNVICPPRIRSDARAGWRERAGLGVFTGLCAAILLGGAQGAWALPKGFGTSCSVYGGTSAQSGSPEALEGNAATFPSGCGSQVSSNGRVVVTVQTDAGPSLFNFDQTANASAIATAGMGSVGALAKSDSTSTPEAYLYTTNGNGGITEDAYTAGGNSSATSLWWDSLTVGGTPNDNGYVVLEFSLDLHGQTSASPLGASASILARLFITDGSRYVSSQILGLDTPGTVSDTIGFRPGQEVQIYGDLNAITQSSAGRLVGGAYVSASNAAADAANTAGFRIDVVTPGGSYSTLSGQSYATVPEPAAASPLAIGLLGCMGVMRRSARLGVEQALLRSR